MVCYILDGYNIIHQIAEFSNKTLACKRELLIKFLIQKKPQGSYKNKVIVVFDGNPEVFARKYEKIKNYNIEIIFSSDQTADEKIKQIVNNLKNPGNFAVVTDDKEIKYYANYYGVRVLSVKEFMKTGRTKPSRYENEKLNMSESEIRKINEELRKKFKIY